MEEINQGHDIPFNFFTFKWNSELLSQSEPGSNFPIAGQKLHEGNPLPPPGQLCDYYLVMVTYRPVTVSVQNPPPIF